MLNVGVPELSGATAFGCVAFRYVPADAGLDADAVNAAIPRTMFEQGPAVIGHTVVRGRPALKLTLCNPCTEPDELDVLLDAIASHGAACERHRCSGAPL